MLSSYIFITRESLPKVSWTCSNETDISNATLFNDSTTLLTGKKKSSSATPLKNFLVELPDEFFDSPVVLNTNGSTAVMKRAAEDGDDDGDVVEVDLGDLFLNETLLNSTDAMMNDTITCEKNPYDYCFRRRYDTTGKKIYGGLELVLVVWSVYYLYCAAKEISFLGFKLFRKTVAMCPSRVLFLIACIFMVLATFCRIFCLPGLEDRLAIVIMVFTGCYFLFFCRYNIHS